MVVNSQFTKKVVDKEYGIKSIVLYPPVSSIGMSGVKEKTILSVGRFEPSLNTKHQDILIDAFRELSPIIPGWKLVLAGGSSSDEWLEKLKQKAAGLRVEFATNVSHTGLSDLYQKATIYWHAAGYVVDEVKNPELTEHFGISTVEAISAGCTPLVVPYGGQREIITDSNFHWTTIPELVDKTQKVIVSNPCFSLDISKYTVDTFASELKKLL